MFVSLQMDHHTSRRVTFDVAKFILEEDDAVAFW
jgi:hypothetical protein